MGPENLVSEAGLCESTSPGQETHVKVRGSLFAGVKV